MSKIDICGDPAIVLPDVEPCTDCEAIAERVEKLESKTENTTTIRATTNDGTRNYFVPTSADGSSATLELYTQDKINSMLISDAHIVSMEEVEHGSWLWHITKYSDGTYRAIGRIYTHATIETPGVNGWYRNASEYQVVLPNEVQALSITGVYGSIVPGTAGAFITCSDYSGVSKTIKYWVYSPIPINGNCYFFWSVGGVWDITGNGTSVYQSLSPTPADESELFGDSYNEMLNEGDVENG